FVPIVNVDGHERTSPFNRINQRGPDVTGWRTNAQNLNLNRDYTRLDTEEIRAVAGAIDRWRPDLMMDIHVSDGGDYQYDITFGWNSTGYSPQGVRWMEMMLGPALNRDLRSMGHLPGPLIENDPAEGLTMTNLPPRFATGYCDIRHIPSVLVETHSLKTYEERVLGTLVLMASALETVGREGMVLKRSLMADSEQRINPVPLEWRVPKVITNPEMIDFLGVESQKVPSTISGTTRVEYLGKPMTRRITVERQTEVATSVPRAKA